jgi:hypothetical protein
VRPNGIQPIYAKKTDLRDGAMINIEKHCEALRVIAEQYPDSSDEYRALELAAWALHFVRCDQMREKFQKYVDNIERELTEEEKRELRAIGVEID